MELAFGLASLSTGVVSLVLAVAILLGNPALRENRAWAMAGLSTTIWAGGMGFAILAPTKEQAFLWNRIFYTGAVWIPTTFLWFVSVFTSRPPPKLWLRLSIVTSFCLTAVLCFRFNWFVKDLVQRGPFRYWEVLGPAYHVFSVLFFLNMAYALKEFYWALKTSSSLSRKKIKWLFVATGIAIFGGSTNFFLDYEIPIYPFGQFLVILYPLLVSWAVIRHQALDIRTLFRKTSLLFGIYFLLLMLVVPLLIYLHHEMQSSTQAFSLTVLFEIVVVSGVLSLGPFVYAYLVQRGSFFQEYILAGLTHELKSPLAVMESTIEALRENLQEEPASKKQGEYIEMLSRNTDRLRGFIDDLLHVYKIENKKTSFQRAPADVVSLCSEVTESLRSLARAKKLELELKTPSEPIELSCDPVKIKQVISNLLSNAIKFTNQGSVRVALTSENGTVEISVEDTGEGIAQADLPYVFDRFFQGSRDRTAKGTGIGLSIAKIWVENHGGRLYCASDGMGKGSRFWFTLPHK